MRKMVGVWVVVGVLACDKKGAPESGPGSAAPSPVVPAPIAPPPVAPVEPPAGSAAGSSAAPAADLPPLSADVLPKGEATPNTRAVLGSDYRFQIPQDFAPADRGGVTVYTGTVKGFGEPASLTLWATSEPFKGDLEALVAREAKAAMAAGASDPDVGPVMLMLAGDVKQNHARRMTIRGKDTIELRTVVAHAGRAYIHHCETPNVANAWANVGSDCTTRALTFHVAPPASKPAAARPGGAPPETANVMYLASKLEGTARKKADVTPWLDDAIAPYVKPCLAKLASGTRWEVSFELGKDGSARNVEVGDGDALVAAKDVTACAAKVVEAAKLDGTAAGPVRVVAVFAIK